jgi:hypothetical protein
VRWEQVSPTSLLIQASYYDASADRWFRNVIDGRFDLSNVADKDGGTDNVNFLDGFHTASSITIDSPDYAIRRYSVGTLETYP